MKSLTLSSLALISSLNSFATTTCKLKNNSPEVAFPEIIKIYDSEKNTSKSLQFFSSYARSKVSTASIYNPVQKSLLQSGNAFAGFLELNAFAFQENKENNANSERLASIDVFGKIVTQKGAALPMSFTVASNATSIESIKSAFDSLSFAFIFAYFEKENTATLNIDNQKTIADYTCTKTINNSYE